MNVGALIKRHGFWLALASASTAVSAVLYVAYGEADSWLLFYALDLAAILSSACAAPFVGVHGVVALCGASGSIFALALLLNFSRFFVRAEVASVDLGPVFKLPGVSHGIVLYVDCISYGFALLTALISSCVFVYAFSYMRFEKGIVNFLVFLKLFG